MKIRRMNNGVLEMCNESNQIILSIAEKILPSSTMQITLVGEITNDVAHEFEDEVMATLSVCRVINLDLSGVSYMASMALKTLLSIQQMVEEMDDADMVITRVSTELMTIFKETGFTEILKIEEA